MKQHDKNEPLFLIEDVAAELAAGYGIDRLNPPWMAVISPAQ